MRRQRDLLHDDLETVRREIAQLREEQPLVQSALLSAHRTAREVVEQAEEQAATLCANAQQEARDIADNARRRSQDVVSEAEDERARIEQQAARMRNLAKGLRTEYMDLIGRAVELLDDGDASTTEPVIEMQDPLKVAGTGADA